MKFNWQKTRLAAAALGLLAVAGCGGIQGSHSISPASFFLPGLVQGAPITDPSATPMPMPASESSPAENPPHLI